MVRPTSCPAGHPYAGPNVYIDRTGRRHCVTCRNLRKREKRARLRAERIHEHPWLGAVELRDDGTCVVPLAGASGGHALVDVDDLGLVARYTWRLTNGYAATDGPGRRKLYMHRLLLAPPPHLEVDHRNRDRLDNRRANLRLATRSQQVVNAPKPNRTGFRGVSAVPGGRWGAWIKSGGRSVNIGVFDTPEDAARAYDARALAEWGEFAILNFSEQVA